MGRHIIMGYLIFYKYWFKIDGQLLMDSPLFEINENPFKVSFFQLSHLGWKTARETDLEASDQLEKYKKVEMKLLTLNRISTWLDTSYWDVN